LGNRTRRRVPDGGTRVPEVFASIHLLEESRGVEHAVKQG